jgi:hypothetical protein
MDERSAVDQSGLDAMDLPFDLRPGEDVLLRLVEGRQRQQCGDHAGAAQRYSDALEMARSLQDQPGAARALAQLAALEESTGNVDAARNHNEQAATLFLAIGDGAGLVQSYRLEAFLYLRQDQIHAAATAFARALALALQLDTRLVMTTLNQILPAARYLIESGRVADLLPLGAALLQAVDTVEQQRGEWPEEMADVAEIARTIAALFPPLAVMAAEADLSPAQRRSLAARATHQAWMVDALTRRRWNLADLVGETLKSRLEFYEKLD